MKLKHVDIEIPIDEPFKNCKLDRRKYGQILTDIVNSYADGFVLAIDNKWGTGKTTFVKMWRQQLENSGFKTLYFNSWANDFDSHPLVAILSELKTMDPTQKDPSFKKMLKKGAIITQNVLPILAKAIAEKYLDVKVIKDAVEGLAKSAGDILKDEVDEYSTKKESLIEFKEDLKDYIAKHTSGKPLVFIIDELDRCKPSYEVEVLEQIKHFFSVPGIIFVLAIDKVQLGNAIKGYYGSDCIDSNEYLRRFIDIEYAIPSPPTGLFCKYLFNYYQFDLFFNQPDRKHPELINDKEQFLKIAIAIFEKNNVTLRQQEQIFAHARLALTTVPTKNYLFPETYLLLTFLRSQKKEFYQNLSYKTVKLHELISTIKELLPENLDKYDMHSFVYLEAELLLFYDNYCKKDYAPSNLYKKDEESKENVLLVESAFGDQGNQILLQAFNNFRNTRRTENKLSVILNRLDLLDSIV